VTGLLPFERSEPVPGVRLVTERMPHVRSASIGFWVDAGARDEPDELAGAAHMLEHLLFKGTSTRSARDIADAFDTVGGELNAYAAHEHTCFYARVVDTDVELAVDVLCDMFLHGALRAEDLSSERKVVLEEIHMAADVPEDHVHDLFAAAAWGDRDLGRPILGTPETVSNMDRDALCAHYKGWYTPDRLIVAVAGSTDHASVGALLRARLEPGTVPATRRANTHARFSGGSASYDRRDSEQVHLVWGFESLAREDPDRYALAVLNALYGGGMSSRLFQEIREDRGLAYSVYSGYHSYVETGFLNVYAGTQSSDAATVLQIARDQAADVAAGGAGEREVERAKGQVKGGLVLSMDDPGGRMTRLGRSEQLYGEILSVDELLARIDAVSPEDVARTAKRVFCGGRPVLACVGRVADGSLDFAVQALGY
jgi:predicted Zn-dependent peptidase